MLRSTLVIFLCTLGLWHFLAILVFVGPQNPFTETMRERVERYINPIFTQNWRLFAPEPSLSDFKFWYRCRDEHKNWSPWIDPAASLLAKHKDNRLSYRGKLLYIYNNISTGLYNKAVNIGYRSDCQNINNDCETKILAEIERTEEYALAKRYSSDLCKSQFAMLSRSTTAVEFRTVEMSIKPFSQRENENFKMTKKFFNYPVAMLR